ncbi:MAG: dockerin type I repeat-containing protein, partial [Clostridia bacterium]|nr:dockerin type I repeat-containing protein [Clostridia bacterium]
PVDPNNHVNTELRNAVAPTCTEGGYSGDLYCLDCLELVKAGAAVPAAGHSFSDWTVERPATTDSEGLETRVCSACGKIESRELPMMTDVRTVTGADGALTAVIASSDAPEDAVIALEFLDGGTDVCLACLAFPANDLAVVEMTAESGEEELSFDASVTALLPEGFDPYTAEVYELTPDGCVPVGTAVADGALVFWGGTGTFVIVDTTAELETEFTRGDIDGDGTVTAADARLALRIAVGLEEVTLRQRAAGDVDLDGASTPADARLILRKVVGLEEFPEPPAQ